MDAFVNELLQEVKALRNDIGSARAEAALNHVEIVGLIGVVRAHLDVIDARLATMDRRQTAGLHSLTVAGVASVARLALLGA